MPLSGRCRRPVKAVWLTAVLWFVAGCGDDVTPTSRESLEAGSFLTAEGTSVTLSQGQGSGGDIRYSLITTAEGDLDFDGELDAAAVVAEVRGNAVLLRLHALLGEGDIAQDVSARLIGDRIAVQRLEVQDGVIRVDLLIRNPGEPITVEPSVLFAQHFVLTDRGLTPIVETRVESGPATEQGSVDAESDDTPALYTHEWVLDTFEMGEWVADPSGLEEPASVRFVAELVDLGGASGEFSGFAGCNRIFGSFRAEESDVLRVAGLAATRRACDSGPADFEERFLAAFASVQSYMVTDDRLELSFDGGKLSFSASGRLAPAEAEASSLDQGDPARIDPVGEARRAT